MEEAAATKGAMKEKEEEEEEQEEEEEELKRELESGMSAAVVKTEKMGL